MSGVSKWTTGVVSFHGPWYYPPLFVGSTEIEPDSVKTQPPPFDAWKRYLGSLTVCKVGGVRVDPR